MKLASISVATAIGLSCGLIPSCNPTDTSAILESRKALDEAMAKNIRLNEEISALKVQIEEAKSDLDKAKTEGEASLVKTSQPEELKMPSVAEVEGAMLDQEIGKLKEQAKQQFPGAKVESLGTGAWDVISPSDSPFSCKAKVALKEENGTRRTLYWTGSANLKGEWKFKVADNLETKPPDAPTAVVKSDVGTGSKKPEAPSDFVPPTLKVAGDGESAKRNTKDAPKQPTRPKPPAAPEKPKQKFDINFDNPVMGPGSR